MMCKPLPEGLDFAGSWHPLQDVTFLRDITYLDGEGVRRHDQQIMDAMLEMIVRADSLLVLDQFLFNDFAGKETSILRPLSSELTEAILARKASQSGLSVWFITDPLNTMYGGLASPAQSALRAGGVQVIQTRLTALRDSNPAYSAWWRIFLRFWPRGWGPWLPNPVGPGRVPLRSYLDLMNFKANHRKTVVADRDGALWGLVSSANPHDASSAHHNVAVLFGGPAARDLLETERAVARFSGVDIPAWDGGLKQAPESSPVSGNELEGRILTERSVERAAIELLDSAESGDRVVLAMFYLSSRPVIRGLVRAHARGVKVQVLLDPNKDAFGREKNGVPNRPVGAALHRAGIEVRWARTHGEQFHSKLLARFGMDGQASVLVGSSNYTRRNLHNYNLETCIEVRGSNEHRFMQDVSEYLDQVWSNPGDRVISGGYETYADERQFSRWLYRIQESTGLSTF